MLKERALPLPGSLPLEPHAGQSPVYSSQFLMHMKGEVNPYIPKRKAEVLHNSYGKRERFEKIPSRFNTVMPT
jgi:hypothetical protein